MYVDCFSLSVVSLTPILAKCSRATFVEMLGQRVDLLLILTWLPQSSICASVWLVNDDDITKLTPCLRDSQPSLGQ